jgi:hypothetical protein
MIRKNPSLLHFCTSRQGIVVAPEALTVLRTFCTAAYVVSGWIDSRMLRVKNEQHYDSLLPFITFNQQRGVHVVVEGEDADLSKQ